VVDYVVTPDEIVQTGNRRPRPDGIDWRRLPAAALAEMPVLAELRTLMWERLTVRDVLAPGLAVVFVGINPGRYSAATGHHFAGPGNYFWQLVAEAGFTPRRLEPAEDHLLPTWGVGVTNLVDRATRGEADLTWDEMQAAARELRRKLAAYRPRFAALLGKQVYRAYAGLPRSAAVDWGLQPRETVAGVREFVAPNPSPRSTVPVETRLALFRELRSLAAGEMR